MTPIEHTSSDTVRKGGITKSGNHHARWFLVECVQHYVLTPKLSKELTSRQTGQSARIKEISWNAQTRLHGRYRALLARGKCRQKAITAIARELLGFIWAALREHRQPGSVPPCVVERSVRSPRLALASPQRRKVSRGELGHV